MTARYVRIVAITAQDGSTAGTVKTIPQGDQYKWPGWLLVALTGTTAQRPQQGADPGPLGCYELRQIAARASAAGLAGKVAVSHAFALGGVDDGEFGRTAEALARADVAIMTNGPGPVPMPPVRRLAAAGVRVFAGSDNIRDAWSPLGNGDMLERAMLIAYRQDFRSDAELELAFDLTSRASAQVLGFADHGVRVGAAADLVAMAAGSVAEAVAARPRRSLVMKRGRVMARDGALVGAG